MSLGSTNLYLQKSQDYIQKINAFICGFKFYLNKNLYNALIQPTSLLELISSFSFQIFLNIYFSTIQLFYNYNNRKMYNLSPMPNNLNTFFMCIEYIRVLIFLAQTFIQLNLLIIEKMRYNCFKLQSQARKVNYLRGKKKVQVQC